METSQANLISVSVPSRAEYVHVLRAVTASVAARVPVSFDGIEDLRLAVDEACGRLLAVGGDSTTMTLTLRPLPDRLEAVIAVDGVSGDWPPPGIEETLGWRVLSALVDTLTMDADPGGPAIRLTKRVLGRQVPSPSP